MAREQRPGGDQLSDALGEFLDRSARVMALAGLVALTAGVAMVVLNITRSAAAVGDLEQAALDNIALFGKVAFFGGIAAALGLCWLQWGEEVLGPLVILAAAAFYLAPTYLPTMLGAEGNARVSQSGYEALQGVGVPLGIIGLFAIVFDVAVRVRQRSREGSRADQLRYGKGIKEERDIRNVFLGKCWQLPFCRKFVRERCPIYHARRTCWKEQVGCMCEESVIRNAMEGRIVPSDVVAAAQYIPRNSRISPQQKKERCNHCVIYNEHQKHKYKLLLPVALGSVVLSYAMFREPLVQALEGLIQSSEALVRRSTLADEGAVTGLGLGEGASFFHEAILAFLALVLAAYLIRLIEFLVFRLKI
jgi:hypothetical protein